MKKKHYFVAHRFEHVEFYALTNGIPIIDCVLITHVEQVYGLKDINIIHLPRGSYILVDEILLKRPFHNITVEFKK